MLVRRRYFPNSSISRVSVLCTVSLPLCWTHQNTLGHLPLQYCGTACGEAAFSPRADFSLWLSLRKRLVLHLFVLVKCLLPWLPTPRRVRPSTYLHTVYRRLLTVQKGKKKQEITVRLWPAAACISRENYVHLHTMTKKSLGISHWYFHQKGTLLVCIDLSTSFYYYAEVFIIMQKILERAANCVCCKHVKRQTIIFAIV